MDFIEKTDKLPKWFTPQQVQDNWNESLNNQGGELIKSMQLVYDTLNFYSGNLNSNKKKAEQGEIKLLKSSKGKKSVKYCLINSVASNDQKQKESCLLETICPFLSEINDLRKSKNFITTDLMVVGNTTDLEAGYVYLWCNPDNEGEDFFQLTLGITQRKELLNRLTGNTSKLGVNVKVLAVFVDKNYKGFESYLKLMLGDFLVKNFDDHNTKSNEVFYSNRGAILKFYHLYNLKLVNEKLKDNINNLGNNQIKTFEDLIKLDHQLGIESKERK